MERLIKQATLIDFLGILLPGAVFVIAVHYYGVWDVASPWNALFGAESASLLIYFAGVSYLCGSVIHQIGAVVEQCLTFGPLRNKNMHEKYWNEPAIQDAYRKTFGKEPPKENDKREWQIAAGREVFRTIQRGERPQRIILFSAFYTMSRAMVLSLTCVGIMAIWHERYYLVASIPTICVCVVGGIVFYRRWIWYESHCVDEAYRIFLQKEH